ncbi:arginine--tRNA ligase [Flavipsychrobacter stenotrophus]|uniref:Arginine--tRNA ligase n=1 Tax=Flavipsychrobacter stenotrophus TaxID=2077091 RepID=A0A2S7T0C8_9BACT|nr:arginine--tRNA ligase [Flavipsychrobacter stenotrophus]PQJ12275.1 arginine--tRNA ligase [Flavipsychrobacter stenotrophus]
MTLFLQTRLAVASALKILYPDAEIKDSMISVNLTKPEFTGDYTVVLFPFVKLLRMKPDALGVQLGDYLVANTDLFSSYAIVSGFLNMAVKDNVWGSFLLNNFANAHYGEQAKRDNRVMVEYSSPNTNKPLHFGHMRNIFLGAAVSQILKAAGNEVVKANLINDRGIHICKSMIAWEKLGNNATPESAGMKGDHLVGYYYVKFNDLFKAQVAELIAAGKDEKAAEKEAPIMIEAQEMLRKWEAGDPAVYGLWQTMNGWVYEGFDVSYKKMGITFDKTYHESETYLLGKELVQSGLEKGVLFKKDDGSVWIDLKDEGLDEKLLLRGDGTSVYITQDLGTAKLKYDDFKLNQSLYVIADEQNYHMQVLKLILKKMGEPCGDGIHHLSYGMVELPSGRMKSREGTVVDADDMVEEMISLSREQAEQNGKTAGFTEEELGKLYDTVGLGALKFYLLRVDPKKKMIFDPKESIDLHGFTATFIQYAHTRICSILRKENVPLMPSVSHFQAFKLTEEIAPLEKAMILHLEQYPTVLAAAADEYNPSELCIYAFQLAQTFNSFYDVHSISKAESEEKKQLRLMIVVMAASILRHSMNLLGIALPEKM